MLRHSKHEAHPPANKMSEDDELSDLDDIGPGIGYDYLLKVVIVGDTVGKSNILMRFASDSFTDMYYPTIGVDFNSRTLDVDGKGTHIQIWDTSGQERFDSITTSYFRGAMAIVLVYDITNEVSFRNVTTKWITAIEKHASVDVIKMIVGNKCDLEESRVVSRERGQLVADDYGAIFNEVSAKSGHNVTEAFTTLAHEFIKKHTDKSY